jgi:hypothetical protein
MARVGASDGTNTEVSGREIAEGDLIISGERSATETSDGGRPAGTVLVITQA